MRPVRYSVAMSLDGFIARPNGSFDWIPTDVEIDWNAFLGRFDTILMGRRTYDVVREQPPPAVQLPTYVFSSTLKSADHDNVTIIKSGASDIVRGLKAIPGKEIWLMGGGVLFRSLLEDHLVDVLEIAIVPILLGNGIPCVPPLSGEWPLNKTRVTEYEQGLLLLEYTVKTSEHDQ